MADFSFTPEQKQTIVQRAQACCEYCISQVKFSPDPLLFLFRGDHRIQTLIQ